MGGLGICNGFGVWSIGERIGQLDETGGWGSLQIIWVSIQSLTEFDYI